jgi:predicted ester cyclase
MSEDTVSTPERTHEEQHKALLRRFEAATSSGDPELIARTIDELVDPDVQISTPLPVASTGAEALKEVFARLHSAFPDLRVEVEDLIAEGDKVVSRNRVTATHRGEYMGVAPTGRTIEYDEIFIVRFDHGRMAETWGVVDIAAQMKQLGLI